MLVEPASESTRANTTHEGANKAPLIPGATQRKRERYTYLDFLPQTFTDKKYRAVIPDTGILGRAYSLYPV